MASDGKILQLLDSLHKLDIIQGKTSKSSSSNPHQCQNQLPSDWNQKNNGKWRICATCSSESSLKPHVYEASIQYVEDGPVPAQYMDKQDRLDWKKSAAFSSSTNNSSSVTSDDEDLCLAPRVSDGAGQLKSCLKNRCTPQTSTSHMSGKDYSAVTEDIYAVINKERSGSNMPTSTMATHTIPSSDGNEYGITNVSSQGRVSITVVPPRQHASRSRSQTPFDHDFKSRAPPASAHSFIGNNTEGTSSYSSVVSSNAGYRRYDSDSRVSPSSGVSGGSYTSSTANPPPLKPPRASSNHAEDSHSTRLKELYYRKQLENSGHEQNELDEILRELLGDAHNAGLTTTSSSSKRQESVTRSTTGAGGGSQSYRTATSSTSVGNGASGTSWLEQQQKKLNQRQQSRDHEDISQLHRQQKQLVSELKHVQTRRKESLDLDDNANSMYRTEKDVQFSSSSNEPAAYTVFIKPEEFRKPQPIEEKNNVSKKSITNVSHTHHTHYNFQDNGDEVFENDMKNTMEEQRKRIMQLEDELRKVKMGMENPPPVRPQKLDLEDDGEDEDYLFKPVGIASLESGTGTASSRPSHLPSSLSSSSDSPGNISSSDPPYVRFNSTNLNSRLNSTPSNVRQVSSSDKHQNGQTSIQSHTMKSQSSYSGNVTSPQPSLEQTSPPFYKLIPVTPLTPLTIGQQSRGQSLSSPTTPYQLLSPSVKVSSPIVVAADYAQSSHGGQQQRIVTEEQRHQQHMYQHSTGTLPSQMGTLPSQTSTINQVTRQHQQQHQTSYGFNQQHNNNNASSSFVTSPTAAGSNGAALPFNQALHVNTTGAQTNNTSGVTYATIAGSPTTGHVQFLSESSEGPSTDQSQLTAKFVKDTSKYWYKPHISRDEVIQILKNATPGTFIVRDSNSFPGAFGLAVKVAQLPPNVQIKQNSDPASEYVRFYLIEPTTKGVKLKGCSNEPVFASLASLIYQHTITPLALPCKLLLPDPDQYQFGGRVTASLSGADELDGPPLDSPARINGSETTSTAGDLLKRGAACNVIYMNNVDTESLTGPQAISRAVHHTFGKEVLETTIATFKVSADGITITDNNRKIFFRQHFPKESISYCGIDPADRRFSQALGITDINEAKIFGFVAKKKGGNQCLLFAEMDPDQPASAVVNFVTKVLLGK